jgi:O-antigen/teichoic acid export membrane protein
VSPALHAPIIRALAWRSGSQIVAQLISWSATFLVIRLLSPADYGLFALTQPLLALLAMLGGEGIATALIREKQLDQGHVRRVFGLLILVNLALAIVQCLTAPIVAAWCRQPIIADLLRVQALAYLAVPATVLGRALLSRRMDFRSQALASLAAAIMSASVGAIGALSGWGIWTLVAAPLAMVVTRASLLTVAARLWLRPKFGWTGMDAIARFGIALTCSQLLWFGQVQADILIGGRWFDPHQLGLYTTALFLAQILTAKFMPAFNEVAYAGYAQAAGEGGQAVATAFTGSVRMVMAIALPFYAGMALAAEPLVAVVLGDHWTGTAPMVRGLAVAMPWVTLQIMFSPVTNALGRPMHAVYGAAAGCLIMPAAFAVAAPYGVQGFAWAWILGFPLLAIFTAAISLPLIGLRPSTLVAAIAPTAGATLAMSAAIVIIRPLLVAGDSLPTLVATVMCGVTVYGLCLALLWPAGLRHLRLVSFRAVPTV